MYSINKTIKYIMKWIKDEPCNNKDFVFRTIELDNVLITYMCPKTESKPTSLEDYPAEYRRTIIDLNEKNKDN